TATVSSLSDATPGAGEGTVTFKDGATVLCSAVAVGAGGVATCTPSPTLSVGSHSLTAEYSGTTTGNGFRASISSTLSHTVAQASSTTTVTCPTNVTYTGSPLTPCSASVTGAGGLSQTLTVSYSNNTGAGTATASASYAGDANHTASSDSTTFAIAK